MDSPLLDWNIWIINSTDLSGYFTPSASAAPFGHCAHDEVDFQVTNVLGHWGSPSTSQLSDSRCNNFTSNVLGHWADSRCNNFTLNVLGHWADSRCDNFTFRFAGYNSDRLRFAASTDTDLAGVGGSVGLVLILLLLLPLFDREATCLCHFYSRSPHPRPAPPSPPPHLPPPSQPGWGDKYCNGMSCDKGERCLMTSLTFAVLFW